MTHDVTGAPRISLVLLACNQEAWAADAAASVLAQACEPLEIVLSDDASTDGTFAVLAKAAGEYRGPHRVRARRNERNLGIGAHWNRLVAETSGALLVCAAGDDLSLPHRVARLAAAWDASGGTLDLVASLFTLAGVRIAALRPTVELQTTALQPALTSLLTWATEHAVVLGGLSARAASLEQAFLAVADGHDATAA